MKWTVLEALGLALVVAFFAVVWWPAALLAAGLVLVLAALLGERRALRVAGRDGGEES